MPRISSRFIPFDFFWDKSAFHLKRDSSLSDLNFEKTSEIGLDFVVWAIEICKTKTKTRMTLLISNGTFLISRLTRWFWLNFYEKSLNRLVAKNDFRQKSPMDWICGINIVCRTCMGFVPMLMWIRNVQTTCDLWATCLADISGNQTRSFRPSVVGQHPVNMQNSGGSARERSRRPNIKIECWSGGFKPRFIARSMARLWLDYTKDSYLPEKCFSE